MSGNSKAGTMFEIRKGLVDTWHVDQGASYPTNDGLKVSKRDQCSVNEKK